jgi:hypothetical protein
MIPTSQSDAERILFNEVARDLVSAHGHLLTGEALWRALGFRSRATFQRAKAARTLGVTLFPMHEGRGHYALTRDVARYLARLRVEADRQANEPP